MKRTGDEKKTRKLTKSSFFEKKMKTDSSSAGLTRGGKNVPATNMTKEKRNLNFSEIK